MMSGGKLEKLKTLHSNDFILVFHMKWWIFVYVFEASAAISVCTQFTFVVILLEFVFWGLKLQYRVNK